MRKVAVERKGETNFFTSAMIKDCMKKVIAVNLHQVVQVSSFFSLDNAILPIDNGRLQSGYFKYSRYVLEACEH